MASFFDPLRYGWHVVYSLEIEGIPVRWVESPLGLALPTGVIEAVDVDGQGALVIDGSGEIGQLVDRETGIGCGQPLTFTLRHCTAIETYLRRPQLKTFLTADLTADLTPSGVTAFVNSTAGFPGTGTIHIGKEAIDYTGIGVVPPRFTGLTRGQYGSIPSSHDFSTSANVVTDRPRWWRGRQVRLWAYLCTPTGYVPGDRREVWRGTLNTGPDRVGTSWQFEALALDRRLDEPLLTPVAGRVVNTDALYRCEEWYGIELWAWSSNNLFSMHETLFPYFAANYLTRPQQLELITAALATMISKTTNAGTGGALSTYLGAAKFNGAAIQIPLSNMTAATTGGFQSRNVQTGATYAMPFATNALGTWWYSVGELINDANADTAKPGSSAVTLDLDTPDTSPPSKGWLVDGNGVKVWFDSVSPLAGSRATFSELRVSQGGAETTAPAWAENVEVSVRGAVTDLPFAPWSLTMLESSGDGTRGEFDTAPANSGYGMVGATGTPDPERVEVNEKSFEGYGAPANALICVTSAEEATSWVDLCGGMLAIQQCAVVARPDPADGIVRLMLVDVSVKGTAYKATITDADLLTTSDDPVKPLRRGTVPNGVRIVPAAAPDGTPSVTVIDAPQRREQGAVDVEYSLPLTAAPGDSLTLAASLMAAAQTTQILELRVGPWFDLHAGDLVLLDLTHYGVWSWDAGAVGYTGAARVLGSRADPVSLATTLTVLIGTFVAASLCPAALVTTADDPTAPGEVIIPARYAPHMLAALFDAGGPVTLLHYIPGNGDEAGGGTLWISAAAESGSDCVMTVAGAALLYDLEIGRSILTLPETGSGSDYQEIHAHAEDGSQWL